MEPFLKVQQGIKGVFYTLLFFHSAGADNCSAIRRTPSKTRDNFSIIVLERHDPTAGLVRNKQW